MNHALRKNLSALALVVVLISTGCSIPSIDITGITSTKVPASTSGPTPAPLPAAPVTFNVVLPAPLLAGETLYLSIVDEVTGLGLNPVNHAMQSMDATHFSLTLPFTVGSIVTYRYLRQAALPILEDDAYSKPVRYRIYHAIAPGMVEDVVASWVDTPFTAPVGRVSGRIVNALDGNPLTNIMVVVGGQQRLTDTNGAYAIDGLPPGTHNLVAYALDGSYLTFQQGANIMEGRNTPANISLSPASMVTVSFNVTVPDDTPSGAPLRLAGSLYTLGNTFGDLNAGMSTVATRMPTLAPLENGRYTISLMLPAGADIRYKYTLGDGFWNAEHTSSGAFRLRQFIVPLGQEAIQVQDMVSTWKDGSSAPIQFETRAPLDTPAGDSVSIQFNPYGWTEPIPMWPMGDSVWTYRLFSPLNILTTFEYRYCRNDACGLADDLATGPGRLGRPVSSSLVAQDLQDTIDGWNWLQSLQPSALVGLPVTRRSNEFWAGVEFLSSDDPTWPAWMPQAVLNVQSLYSNWLVVDPTWTVSQTNPLVFSPLPGSDPLAVDTARLVQGGRSLNMNLALFPAANLPMDTASWWQSTPRDAYWWTAWFESYAAFATYHADVATQSGAQALILGGDWVLPSLPGGTINGEPSGVPADAEARWMEILTRVRAHFSGQVLWAVGYPDTLDFIPDFASSLDGIYLLWYAPLAGNNSPSVDEIHQEAGARLDNEIQPLQESMDMPVIIAAAYPSADGAAMAWMPLQAVLQPGNTQAAVNLQAQADIYQALLAAINERPWVGGLISRGYYPPTVLHDPSASVHGKPAADILWYWFPRFQGITP